MLEGRGQKILVADPDRTVRELLQIRLEVAGYHALMTRHASQVLELLDTRPAAIIIDAKLDSTMNGFQLLFMLRKRFELQAVPILMMGRNLTVADVERAMKSGAQGVLAKPFSGSDVVERVFRLLNAPAKTPHAPAPAAPPTALV